MNCIWKAKNGNLWIKGVIVGQSRWGTCYHVECDNKVYTIPKENVKKKQLTIHLQYGRIGPMKKALNINIDCGPLDIDHISNMRTEFFSRMDYDWWGEVEPGDVVVDVGACVGFFTCGALDKGASRVYAIEPNRELLQLVMKNAFDYIQNQPYSPVVPIHAAMANDPKHTKHVYDEGSEFPIMSFNDLILGHNITYIDYLKVDCEGGEYSFLTKENLPWLFDNVRHMAIEIHLRATKTGKEDFIKFRDEFLKPFFDAGRVYFMNPEYKNTIWNNDAIHNEEFEKVPAEFMIYIKNG